MENESQDNLKEVKNEKNLSHEGNPLKGWFMSRRSRRAKDIVVTFAILGGLLGAILTNTPSGAVIGGIVGAIIGFMIGD